MARFVRARSKYALLLSAVCAAFILLEVALRVVGVSHPRFHRVDEHRGWSLDPGAEGWWRREGEAFVAINGDGLRDREHSRSKAEGAYRIAVLGDSFAAAFQVPVSRTFWHVLERELEECPLLDPLHPEVINFGVNNYGTAHELLTLQHHAKHYSPDLVVLALFTGNDIYNNSNALSRDTGGPSFEIRDDRLVLDDSFRERFSHRFKRSPIGALYASAARHSRLVQLAAVARAKIGHRQARRTGREAGFERGISRAIYSEPTDARWKNAWEISERLLVAMKRETTQIGADLLVVTLSNPEQVHPDREVREATKSDLDVENLDYPDRRIAATGRRERFAVLNLALPMREHADETGVFLHGFANPGFGHWNEEGHALGGKLIAKRVCESLRGEKSARSDPE